MPQTWATVCRLTSAVGLLVSVQLTYYMSILVTTVNTCYGVFTDKEERLAGGCPHKTEGEREREIIAFESMVPLRGGGTSSPGGLIGYPDVMPCPLARTRGSCTGYLHYCPLRSVRSTMYGQPLHPPQGSTWITPLFILPWE